MKPDANIDDQGSGGASPRPAGARTVLTVVCWVYFFGVTISVPYFNWRYAQEHGFVSWLFFGEIVPTIQALAWPYYVLAPRNSGNWSEVERENLEHFHRSRDAMLQAVRIINSGPSDRLSELRKDESEAIVSLYRLALAEAQQVDLETLAKAHPDLPAHFRDEYLEHLKTINRVYSGDASLQEQFAAHKLYEKWVDWFSANREEIHMPKRRSL